LRTESRWLLRTGASVDAEWAPEPMNGNWQQQLPKMFVRKLPVMEQQGLWDLYALSYYKRSVP